MWHYIYDLARRLLWVTSDVHKTAPFGTQCMVSALLNVHSSVILEAVLSDNDAAVLHLLAVVNLQPETLAFRRLLLPSLARASFLCSITDWRDKFKHNVVRE